MAEDGSKDEKHNLPTNRWSSIQVIVVTDDVEKSIVGQLVPEQSPKRSYERHEDPPDGGYGWVCVGCCFAVNASTWGINSAYGVYLAHYLSANLHPSATSIQYAFIGGIAVAVPMLVGPATTFLFHKGWSTQAIMSVGTLFLTSALLVASFTSNSIISLFLTQGLLCGLGVGFLFTASVGVISQWFHKKRSAANAIAAAGTGFGGLVLSIATNAMIENISLEWAFRITAIVTLIINVLATILLKDRNHSIRPTQKPFDINLFKEKPGFSLILCWGFFTMMGYVAITLSLPDYARSIGLSPKQGSIIAAMLSLGIMFGRPLIGWLSDRYGRINISAIATFISAMSIFGIWMVGYLGGFWICIVFAVLNGAVCGTFLSTVSPVTAEIVGLKDLPSALSIVWLLMSIPSIAAEGITIALRRPNSHQPGTKSNAEYLYPQLIAGMMYVAAGICIYLLRVGVIRKVVEEERKPQSPTSSRAGEPESDKEIQIESKHSKLMNRWRKAGPWLRWTYV